MRLANRCGVSILVLLFLLRVMQASAATEAVTKPVEYDPRQTVAEIAALAKEDGLTQEDPVPRQQALLQKLSRSQMLALAKYWIPEAGARVKEGGSPMFAQAVVGQFLFNAYEKGMGESLTDAMRFEELEDASLPFGWRYMQSHVLRARKLSLADQERLAKAMLEMTISIGPNAGELIGELVENTEKAMQAVQNTIAPGSPVMANAGSRADMMPPAEMFRPEYKAEAQRLADWRRRLLQFVEGLDERDRRNAAGMIDWVDHALKTKAATRQAK